MPRPKTKSEEEKKAALDQLLSRAATTNHLTGTNAAPAGPEGGEAAASAPEPTPGNEEQKGENVSVAPTAETAAPAAPESAATPAPETSAPESPAKSTPAPVAAPMPAPAPTPAPQPEPEAPAAPQAAPVAAVPNVENVADIKHSDLSISLPENAVEAGNVELGLLFTPSVDKKVFTMRLTDAHYQYFLLLGTIVGNGTSPPDIVHNILAQFIEKNDAQIQKAITKQLRQRQGKK